ncbi:unnamed protein product [Urochloa decumbens]|uniref:DUF4005 domain-containing protein n=1 Tax=Urochloa decumbens TaxID=240449 RepID=A0ABC8XLV2_9POAL
MGKAGRWLKSFLSGKKDRPRDEAVAVAAAAAPPKDKRWSFRRAAQEGKAAPAAGREGLGLSAADIEFEQKKHAVAVAVATAAAADAAVAAAHAAAAVARLSSRRTASLSEDAAAVRIQATFRGYLARTALCALRGIVKLQALVRGQLVRKQANATLRCMQALLTAQSHLRAQRMRVLHQDQHHHPPPATRPRQSPQHPRHRRSYEMDRSCEENAKIVEMDIGVPARRGAAKDRQLILHAEHHYARCCSPAPSAAATELMSPRAYSGHFDELSLTARSSPQQQGSEACPSYMANTESSRAKARSQSAPRQRTDALERQPSRRKGTPPRCITARMQRSSSLAGAAPRGGGGQASPWSAGLRLDASSASLKDSECGSTTSVLTAATVYSRTRSLVGFEVRRGLY